MEHHKEGYEEEVVMPSDHETTTSSEDESFTLGSIASSHVCHWLVFSLIYWDHDKSSKRDTSKIIMLCGIPGPSLPPSSYFSSHQTRDGRTWASGSSVSDDDANSDSSSSLSFIR